MNQLPSNQQQRNLGYLNQEKPVLQPVENRKTATEFSEVRYIQKRPLKLNFENKKEIELIQSNKKWIEKDGGGNNDEDYGSGLNSDDSDLDSQDYEEEILEEEEIYSVKSDNLAKSEENSDQKFSEDDQEDDKENVADYQVASYKKHKIQILTARDKYISRRQQGEKQKQIIENQEAMEQINSFYQLKDNIQFRQIPFCIWLLGALILSLGLYLLYVLLFNTQFEGHLWQYLIGLGLVTLGCGFLFSGKIERITLSKKSNLITYEKFGIICQNQMKQHNLKEIRDVVVRKKGQKTINTNTTYYIIEILFNKGKPFEILESNSKKHIEFKLNRIKLFLKTKINPDILELDDAGFEFSSI